MIRIILILTWQVVWLSIVSTGVMYLWNKLLAPPDINFWTALLLTFIVSILTGVSKISLTFKD